MTPAPDFEAVDQDGKPLRLSGFRGRNAVLYFYPRADTPGCTTQARGARDRLSEYEAANAVVLGVSPDKPEKLRKFADKYGLPFTLVSDPDHAIAEKYGVWVQKSMYGKKYMGVERSTFLIGPDGEVVQELRKVKPAEHDDLVLGALAA